MAPRQPHYKGRVVLSPRKGECGKRFDSLVFWGPFNFSQLWGKE